MLDGGQCARARIAALALVIGLLGAVSPTPALAQSLPGDDPSLQSPFGGQPAPELERVEGKGPVPGRRFTAGEVYGLALSAPAVAAQLAETPDARPVVYARGEFGWQVDFVVGEGDDAERVAFAVVDDRDGSVVEGWGGQQVGSELARGYDGAVAQAVNSPWVWIGLTALFLAPFYDPRRPLRLLHLDLAAIALLGVSVFFFNRADITASVLASLPVLAYVVVRSLWLGVRPRSGDGPLLPVIGVKLLAVAAIALLAGRIALNVVDSRVIDIGLAGVVGADRVTSGDELYDGGFSPGIDLRGDVYGPFNYVAYVPFELASPWSGGWDELPAAHAASIGFDLLCVVGLLLLGMRLRAGPRGRELGVCLAFAWLACPFTLYAMNAGANDSLIAALGIGAMLALVSGRGIGSAAGRGAAVALAALAKFGPAATGPLFAAGTGERRWRDIAVFSGVFALLTAALFLPFIPDGGISEVYERTFGYQASRSSPFSIWGQAPSLEPLQTVARVAAAGLAVAAAFIPRRRDPIQVAALACAVTLAVQLTATHWFFFYVVWFLPFFLVAALGRTGEEHRPPNPARAV
ncbi:DUF2029 domain-containing protein [Thermoleophilia bacterium SCSIO 60948]|nr:DUF2029 domain-containing protein [Thermoleophilia bacterium SCSIO 60948]